VRPAGFAATGAGFEAVTARDGALAGCVDVAGDVTVATDSPLSAARTNVAFCCGFVVCDRRAALEFRAADDFFAMPGLLPSAGRPIAASWVSAFWVSITHAHRRRKHVNVISHRGLEAPPYKTSDDPRVVHSTEQLLVTARGSGERPYSV